MSESHDNSQKYCLVYLQASCGIWNVVVFRHSLGFWTTGLIFLLYKSGFMLIFVLSVFCSSYGLVWFLYGSWYSLLVVCLFLPLVFYLCGYNLLFPDLFWQLFDFCVLLLVFSVYLNSNEPKWVHLSIFSHQFWWSRDKHN